MDETYILDSFAVLALLGKEKGSDDVSSLLRQAQAGTLHLLMTWVNVGEVAYIIERSWGQSHVYQVLANLQTTGMKIIPVGQELALTAAHIKAEYPIAYANAFSAALAIKERGTLVTGDPEFKSLEPILSIHWLPNKGKEKRRYP